VLERSDLPSAPAADLGCGGGVATAYLSRRFPLAIGLDVATGAISQARELALARAARCAFVLAEVPAMPFREGAFAFLFDRGCLQSIPRARWSRYFSEVARLLRSGGLLQLYVSKARPAGATARLRSLGRRLMGRSGPGGPIFASPGLIRRMLPEALEVLDLRELPVADMPGSRRTYVYGVLRRI
jgi:SAM-dependent methyltransferase